MRIFANGSDFFKYREAREFLSGPLAGAMAKAVLAPPETIRTRMVVGVESRSIPGNQSGLCRSWLFLTYVRQKSMKSRRKRGEMGRMEIDIPHYVYENLANDQIQTGDRARNDDQPHEDYQRMVIQTFQDKAPIYELELAEQRWQENLSSQVKKVVAEYTERWRKKKKMKRPAPDNEDQSNSRRDDADVEACDGEIPKLSWKKRKKKSQSEVRVANVRIFWTSYHAYPSFGCLGRVRLGSFLRLTSTLGLTLSGRLVVIFPRLLQHKHLVDAYDFKLYSLRAVVRELKRDICRAQNTVIELERLHEQMKTLESFCSNPPTQPIMYLCY